MATIDWTCWALLLVISSCIAVEEPMARAVPGEVCEDNAPNCDEYMYEDLCHDPAYTDWRLKFCRLTCDLCDQSTPIPVTTTPVPTTRASTSYYDPDCHDTISNCNEYQADTCINPYFAEWAHAHCSLYCGFCHVVTPTQITTTVTTHPDGLNEDDTDDVNACFDRLDCKGYDTKSACCGAYEPWARQNCPKHCKFCQPTVPEVRQCNDTDDNCAQYGDDVCTDVRYERFVKEHCAGFCKVCDQPEYVPECASGSSGTTSPPAVTSEQPGGTCADIDDCSAYDIRTSCCGPYESWARHHCPKTCKFCYGSVPDLRVCKDTDPLCDQYGDGLCTNPEYLNFVKEKCAGTCKICEQPEFIPSCANSTNSIPDGSPAGCTDGALTRPEGSTWDTPDCSQRCTCEDEHTDKIVCNPLSCPEPPPNCSVAHIPGQCCPIIHGCSPQ